MTRPMIASDGAWTMTVPRDEWAAENYPRVSVDDMLETVGRLERLHHLIGHPAPEVSEFFVDLMTSRGDGAVMLLRWLRGLDGQARG